MPQCPTCGKPCARLNKHYKKNPSCRNMQEKLVSLTIDTSVQKDVQDEIDLCALFQRSGLDIDDIYALDNSCSNADYIHKETEVAYIHNKATDTLEEIEFRQCYSAYCSKYDQCAVCSEQKLDNSLFCDNHRFNQ